MLSWNSSDTLDETIKTYQKEGLFDMVNDVTILFQEFNISDYDVARKYNVNLIGQNSNIGIGNAFIKLVNNSQTENVLLLEHDWNLIESKETTYQRLKEGLEFLNEGYTCVRYRHRKTPGYPHFSFQYIGKELTYFDKKMGYNSPHLLDSLHWMEPDVSFPDKIEKEGNYFVTTSRYANWTNNPCLYRKEFYLNNVKPFVGTGIDLEENISKWWIEQNLKVAQGEGLFKHNDRKKYGIFSKINGDKISNLI